MQGVSQRVLNLALKALLSGFIILASFWLWQTAVKAQVGLTVEVTRANKSLVATATTVEGREVNDDSWRWAHTEDCTIKFFEDNQADEASDLMGQGWTVELQASDGGASYCFYVEDSAGKKAVASIEVAHPYIEIEQNNDQLQATVANVQEDNIAVDDQSWQWFRYKHVDGSRFGCQTEHQGLNSDEQLREAAQAAEAAQEADGLDRQDVYSVQKDVYLSGQGDMVSLTAEDSGLTYCFQVADMAGITNSAHLLVGEVIVTSTSGKPTSDGSSGSGNQVDPESGDIGQIGVEGGEQGDQAGAEDGGSGNWVRNVGIGLLIIALIIGAVMLIQRSQIKDKDSEEADS